MLYRTAAIAPIAKLKIKLSMSNPDDCASAIKLGGFQYSGTKSGSVNPNGVMVTLDRHMPTRYRENNTYSRGQGNKNARDQTSYT